MPAGNGISCFHRSPGSEGEGFIGGTGVCWRVLYWQHCGVDERDLGSQAGGERGAEGERWAGRIEEGNSWPFIDKL